MKKGLKFTAKWKNIVNNQIEIATFIIKNSKHKDFIEFQVIDAKNNKYTYISNKEEFLKTYAREIKMSYLSKI